MPRVRPVFHRRLEQWLATLRARLTVASPAPKLLPRRRLPVVLATLLVAWMLAPLTARAVEIYSDPCCGPTPQVVYVEPQPVVYVQPQPVVHVTSSPEVVVVETSTPAAEDPPKLKKPLLTWVEATVGAGMWIIPGLEEDVHLGTHLDAALSLRGFYMGVDFTWIHAMKWKRKVDEESCVEKGNLALVGMGFGYRFNPDGRVHPELGASFDTMILDRASEGTKLAFGIGATAGLVVEFPLRYGAIVTSLEVAGHRHIWSQNGFFPPRASASVIGSLGYRFF
jgi:hypothetical protein